MKSLTFLLSILLTSLAWSQSVLVPIDKSKELGIPFVSYVGDFQIDVEFKPSFEFSSAAVGWTTATQAETSDQFELIYRFRYQQYNMSTPTRRLHARKSYM